MLSQKSMEDFFYTNDHYAKVGGVAISELNCLELDFLNRVEWRCIPGKQIAQKQKQKYTAIKYAKEMLDLYYSQLIELMGKSNTITDGVIVHYYKTPVVEKRFQQDDNDEDEDYSGDDDEDDDEIMDYDELEEETEVDCPHYTGKNDLKPPTFKRRRYSNESNV